MLIFFYILIGNVEKLEPNFFDKEKYVIQYENLQLCLRLELKLKKSQWLKQYVEFSKKKRIEPEKMLLKALHKLMSNTVYGKAMENVRNIINVKLARNKKTI